MPIAYWNSLFKLERLHCSLHWLTWPSFQFCFYFFDSIGKEHLVMVSSVVDEVTACIPSGTWWCKDGNCDPLLSTLERWRRIANCFAFCWGIYNHTATATGSECPINTGSWQKLKCRGSLSFSVDSLIQGVYLVFK